MGQSWQVVIGGEGGQGLVVAGVLLGEAALRDGKQAAQTASYGIASRGGFTKSEVVVDDYEIQYPAVDKPNLVLVLTEEALQKYYGKIPEDCIMIYDNSFVEGKYEGDNLLGLPLAKKVREEKMENNVNLPLNVVSLGAMLEKSGIVSRDALEQVLVNRFAKKADLNKKAVEIGTNLVKES